MITWKKVPSDFEFNKWSVRIDGKINGKKTRKSTSISIALRYCYQHCYKDEKLDLREKIFLKLCDYIEKVPETFLDDSERRESPRSEIENNFWNSFQSSQEYKELKNMSAKLRLEEFFNHLKSKK